MELLWQIIGYAGMITIILSFQIKNQKALILTQGIAQIMFVIHYLMIGSTAGAIQNALAVIRAIMLMSGNKYLTSRTAKYVMMALFLLSPALVLKSIWDFLPGIAMLVNTYCIWSMKPKLLRVSQAGIVSPLWIAYNAINLSLPGIFTEVFNLSSALIFLVRMKLRERKEK